LADRPTRHRHCGDPGGATQSELLKTKVMANLAPKNPSSSWAGNRS
jgi:hypothetical protein